MLRTPYNAFVLTAALSFVGCNEAPTDPTSMVSFLVEVSSAPDPAIAVTSTGVTYSEGDQVLEYQFMTTFDVIMSLAADQVGVTISRAGLNLQQAMGGIVDTPVTGEIERFRFDARAAGNRIEPGGEATLSFDVWYTVPNGGREALVTVTLNFVNDNGSPLSQSHEVLVAP